MHVLIAPDKFKGTLTAAQVAEHLAAGIASVAPHVPLTELPVADGGDGTLAAVVAAGFTRVPARASGPTGRPLEGAYARRGVEAVVELAEVSGLGRLPGGEPAPMTASSRGTGELLAAALDAGCRRIVLGVGGSAGTDGGAGMVQALGVQIRRADGRAVAPGGAGLQGAATVSLDQLHPGLRQAELILASDVDNPLLGEHGAAAVYGPQKGADANQVKQLDQALMSFARLVTEATGVDHSGWPGAGAAGGVGYGAMALLGARLRPGAQVILELIGFERALGGAGLVITGEGSLDEQTLHGKAPAGVAAAARAAGIAVIAVCGRRSLSDAQLRAAGFAGAYALGDTGADPAQCLRRPGPLLEQLGATIARERLTRDRWRLA